MDRNALGKVLQTFHSLLVDELNRIFPDIKLELGMPSKSTGWVIPEVFSEQDLLASAKLIFNSEACATINFCSDKNFKEKTNFSSKEMLERLIELFGKKPPVLNELIIGQPSHCAVYESLKNTTSATMLVWFPIQVSTASCSLGLKIS